MEKSSYIYMMGNASRRSLYAGVCASLEKRVWEQKNGLGGTFTKRYKCDRLVDFDRFCNIEFAIAREKEIKGWRRRKKDKLVGPLNPDWKDLAAGWYTDELLFNGKPVGG
jgi:putative endonuclease